MPLYKKQGRGNLQYISPSTLNHGIDLNNSHINYQRVPGIHKIKSSDSSEIEFIAMNVQEIESNDKYVNELAFKQFLSPNTSTILVGESDLKETINKSRVGSELWRLILYLITLLLIIEMVISSNAVRKTSD